MNDTDHRGRPVIVVTGIGVVSSLGIGVEENWEKLCKGRSGIHRIERFPTEGLNTTIAGTVDFLDIEPLSAPALTVRLAELAGGEAVRQAGLDERAFPGPLFLAAPPVEKEWPLRLSLDRAASANGGNAPAGYPAMLAAARQGDWRADYELFAYAGVPDRLADRFGTKGAPISLSTACASGATAIQLGVEALRRGETDAARVLGSDGSIHPESLIRFSLLSALSTRNAEPERAARPFSKGRDGFVMAEGAGALVIETLASARARGATPLAIVRGIGEKADDFHRTRSKPDGSAIIAAMRNALDDAGLPPEAVGYVNAHGTGTPENDKMESLALEAVFGEHARRMAVSSNKSMIGHTLSAAGAIEAVFSVLTLARGVIPPTINHDEPDPAIPLDVVPNTAREAQVGAVMSDSFGFGGQNVCVVLGRA